MNKPFRNILESKIDNNDELKSKTPGENIEQPENKLENRIRELEIEYKQCNKVLDDAHLTVDEAEKNLLKCMRELMPIQNTYLLSVS